jgi:carbamoyl-phosphate synthase large subunit
MNILFSCAGRRNYLIQFFKRIFHNDLGKTIATDISIHAPAMVEADFAELVPNVYVPNYIDRVLEIAQKYEVRAIIPLNDLELPILAAAKRNFLGRNIVPIISEPEIIDICFDKWKTFEFLNLTGLRSPQTYLTLQEAIEALHKKAIRFPLIVKPRWGSGSIGIETVYDMNELNSTYYLVMRKIKRSILNCISQTDIEKAVLIQEKINGIEYGIDVINDLEGHYITTIVKQKLAMRAGETDKAITVSNDPLQKIGFCLGNSLRHVANLDCDILEQDGNYYVLELNPRFGGGYPFSHMAGVNVPAAILEWIDNRKAPQQYFHYEIDRVFSKCDFLVEIPYSNK